MSLELIHPWNSRLKWLVEPSVPHRILESVIGSASVLARGKPISCDVCLDFVARTEPVEVSETPRRAELICESRGAVRANFGWSSSQPTGTSPWAERTTYAELSTPSNGPGSSRENVSSLTRRCSRRARAPKRMGFYLPFGTGVSVRTVQPKPRRHGRQLGGIDLPSRGEISFIFTFPFMLPGPAALERRIWI